MKRLILIVLVSCPRRGLRRAVGPSLLALAALACGGQTALPKGPAPEYEDEPVVTQDAAPAQAPADAGAE